HALLLYSVLDVAEACSPSPRIAGNNAAAATLRRCSRAVGGKIMRHCMPRRPVAGKHGPCYARGARTRTRTEGVRPQARAARLEAARRWCSTKVLGRER